MLIDVRTEPEMEICSLPRSINVPFEEIETKASFEKISCAINNLHDTESDNSKSTRGTNRVHLVFVCHRGNDSQIATKLIKRRLNDVFNTENSTSETCIKEFIVQDVIGGLHAWAKRIDRNFPIY